jgi:hypothetical protein
VFVNRTTVLSTLVRFNRLLDPLIKRTSVLGIIWPVIITRDAGFHAGSVVDQ